jgi:murein DD-endopeptidase MepM/ murein hydrolase activator NlpD
MAYGIPLFAMSDGIVQEFDAKPGHVFSIEHKVSPYLYISSYTHNSYTLARQEYPAVYRGQIITLSGSTPSWGEIKPHLHLDNLKIPLTSKNIANPFGYMAIERQKVYYGNHFVPTVDDIYRDLTEPNSLSYWTVDNLPIFPNSQPTP